MHRLRELTASYHKPRGTIDGGAFLFKYAKVMIGLSLIVISTWLCLSVWLQLRRVPDLAFLRNYHPIDSIEIYDKNDKLVCAINREDNRKTVALNLISQHMQQAVLSAEDRHFYEHHGINAVSIGRALIINTMSGKVVEGGSTITQQLVKNMFFPEVGRTMVRKTAEAIVAEQVESRYSKDDILCMYLNEIYFGNGAHGIENAAQTYFGKSAADLNVPESAFLAGLVKAPSVNGSIEHRDDSIERQHDIIDGMKRDGFITDEQATTAKLQPLKFKLARNKPEARPNLKFPYYVSYVLDQIHGHYDGNQIRRHGLRVYTNLDPIAQEAAEEQLKKDIKYAPRGVDEEALVSISLKDGAVRAIVGGVGDYWDNQWNCATNKHTVGSAFKPFVYLTAFMNGKLTPDSIIEDKPLTINQVTARWTPKNFDGRFRGKITVRDALVQSRNVCAVRAAQLVGINRVAETARLAGIDEKLEPNLSLALGSCAVSPLQMAGAYGTIARGGVFIRPWTVRRVDDWMGQTIESFDSPACRVLPEKPVAQLVDVMRDVV
ncbi:MAG: transglycosylase domain-containing protein, partial [Terriglobales bacterium]